jgi:hypothetical protein|nr:FlgD immunoglobulin-like domain containing protein [Candidatus Krumholzibacteria bacterium]
MKTIALFLYAGILVISAGLSHAGPVFVFSTIEFPEHDCLSPEVASSDDGLTMVSFAADGVVTMRFIVTQLMPTQPAATGLPDKEGPWPEPVTVTAGSSAKLCWSRNGFTLAVASSPFILLYQSDLEGNWDTENVHMMDAGGEILSLDLWGVASEAAGPAVYLTWNSSGNPGTESGRVYFASRSAFGWSEPEILMDSSAFYPPPFPQVSWHLGPAGPLPTVYFLRLGAEDTELVYRSRNLDLSWTEPALVPAGPSGGTCFGGPFDVVTSYQLEKNILGLGPQPTCPCGSIYHQFGEGLDWSSCDHLTVDHGYFNWPMSPCLDVESDGTVHALWYQLDSAEDLTPHRRYLEYRVGRQGQWEDAGDFLDALPSGPIQNRLALGISPNDVPVLAGTRRDTIAGIPHPAQVWVARLLPSSPAPDPEVPPAPTALHAWPNPFNPVVNLEFSLAGAAEVQLDIFDSRGRLMTRLVDRHLATGPHTLRWHGLDSSGHPAPSGLYFARLTVADQVTTQKVVLAK